MIQYNALQYTAIWTARDISYCPACRQSQWNVVPGVFFTILYILWDSCHKCSHHDHCHHYKWYHGGIFDEGHANTDTYIFATSGQCITTHCLGSILILQKRAIQIPNGKYSRQPIYISQPPHVVRLFSDDGLFELDHCVTLHLRTEVTLWPFPPQL